jgi:two-component system response regulator HydG
MNNLPLTTTRKVLIVDDEVNMCELIQDALSARDYQTTSANDAVTAMGILRQLEFDCVLTDIKMPGTSGLELCKQVTELRPDLPVVVMTAFGNMETAVDALRCGAFDFVTKPFEVELLVAAIDRAVKHRSLSQQVKRLRQAVEQAQSFGALIGESEPMLALYDLLARICDTESTILIRGESGTGKELVARSIHQKSRRQNQPFVAVNCAALPESLLESELFGHVKGAFTDAGQDKQGLFERANHGTLFLDEIGEMPLPMQSKLLRVLEESKVVPVGGSREIVVNVRLISATNCDLEKSVAEKTFRQDLYFRINVIPVEVPPLRTRGSDILLLAQHFLQQFAAKNNRDVTNVSPAAAQRLLEYRWPGNVRELRNTIERAVALTQFDQLTIDDLPEKIQNYQGQKMVLSVDNPDQLLPLSEIERQYIQRVLEATGGNKTLAAKLLGFDRTTLYRKLEQFDIDKS